MDLQLGNGPDLQIGQLQPGPVKEPADLFGDFGRDDVHQVGHSSALRWATIQPI